MKKNPNEKFNEFEDRTNKEEPIQKSGEKNNSEQVKIRVRLPRKNEILGIINQRLGGKRVSVNCFDGKTRVCRVPGRLKRKLWLRVEDIIIVEPWELDNSKGDVLFKYEPTQVEWLKKKGYLKKEQIEF